MTCGDPTAEHKEYLIETENSHNLHYSGDTVTLKCVHGYIKTSHLETRDCDSEGTWSEAPTCEKSGRFITIRNSCSQI